LVLILSIVIALLARKGLIAANMSDIMVASGSFGAFLLFFISVGEIYSIGTLIGAPGAVYSKGANYGIWFICYILLAYVVGYLLNPAIWKLGQLSKAVTIADLFGWRFNSKAMQVLVALVCILFLIPWVQNQFAGMAILLKYLDLGINFGTAVVVSALIAFVYIAAAGIRSSAYVSILKDFLLIMAVVAVGTAAIVASPNGVSGIFHSVAQKMPHMLTVTTHPVTAGATFTLSTILFQMLGFYMLPFTLQGTLSSKSARNLRKNAVLMPIYMVMFPFLMIAAYFALVNIPGLEKPDFALLAVAVQHLPGWVIGTIAGGGALTAILVMAFTALSVGGLFSKNILAVIKPDMGQAQMVRWTQIVTAVFLAAGVVMTLYYPALMAGVITVSYSGLTQTFVGLFFAFFWKGCTKWGVGAGLLAGVIYLFLPVAAPYGLNKGIIAMAINVLASVLVSLLTQPDAETQGRFEIYKQFKETAA
jgi:SSS family solute:Na+ symporter